MKTLSELKEVLLDSVLKRNISNLSGEKIGERTVKAEIMSYLFSALLSTPIAFFMPIMLFMLISLKPTLSIMFLTLSLSTLFLKKGLDFVLNRRFNKAIKNEDLTFFKNILNKNEYPFLRTLKYKLCSDNDMVDPLEECLLKLPLDKKEMTLLFTNLEIIIGESATDYYGNHEGLIKIITEDGNFSTRYLIEIIRLCEDREKYKSKEKIQEEVKEIIKKIKKENVSANLKEEEIA